MKIGEALHTERLNLGLTQQQMCAGILSRSFYAKVESGKNKLNAESLIKILLSHQIDITEFYNLVKDDYASSEMQLVNQLQIKMDYAVNTKNIDLLDEYSHQINALPHHKILKLRVIVTVAYFKGDLSQIDKATKAELKTIFYKGNNWIKNPELLQLFANTMPVWPQEELNFLIGRLLSFTKNKQVSELMSERYLRIFINYLVTCYDRKIDKNDKNGKYIDDVIDYAISASKPFHLMIYRFSLLYTKALIENDREQAETIRNDLTKYGYGDVIANWSKHDGE